MKTDLVVTRPFGSYQIGDRITDTDAKKAALEDNASSVVQAAHIPEHPDPDAKPAAGSSKS